MKSAILAFALALSMALPALAKDKADCQKPSGRGAKGCLAAERVVIDSATHEILRYRTIEFDADPKEGVNNYYGLADLDGRQILAPDFMKLEVINKHWAYGKVQMQGEFLIDIRTGARTKWTYGLNEIDFNGAKFILVGTQGRGAGATARVDLHRLGHDGQMAADYPSVMWRARVGPFLVLNVADEPKMNENPRPTGLAVWLDQSGQVVKTSPEIVTVMVGNVVRTLIVSDPKPPLRIPLSLAQPFTYQMYDDRGAPVTMPNGITGVAPIQDPFKMDVAYAPWDGWILVREKDGVRDVRMARGNLETAMSNFETLLRVDDAAVVTETVINPFLGTTQRQLVVHEAGKGWALYPSLGGNIGHNRFTSPQEAANLFASNSAALRDRQVAESNAREQAAAAARAAQYAAGVESFNLVMSRRHLMSETQFRNALQAAAFQAGGNYVSQFLSMFPDAAESPGVREAACKDSAVACDTAMRNHNAIQAAYNEKQRQIFEQRVALTAKFNAMNNPNPDVRVNIYENGQFRSEVMPKSHYDKIYK